MKRLGVDTGGTFTDFVLWDEGQVRVHKVLSTPEAPEKAILQGIRELGLEGEPELAVIHGSTVATNAVLEGRGVRTVYITNHGLGDVLTIGRQARRELYNLQPARVPAPVRPEDCLETGGRLGADGAVVEDLNAEDLDALAARVRARAPQAVAINLLFSWRDDRFERAVEQALSGICFVTRSSGVLAEIREYERGIATWLNAYVGPLMQGYLARLGSTLGDARLTVMQSHGGTLDADQAGRHGVRLLLSGPAGGLRGALHLARASGVTRLLSFDMGGTSTDVALLDGDLRLTGEGRIAGYPVAVPMVDMHTIGAGGGSLAWVDAGGLLQVGPRSAGARPGPACYGLGGREPTVTDANLLLGRLPPDTRLAGGMPVDLAAARAAFEPLAARLNLSLEQAAEGVIRLANEHMAGALREISLARGHDPRQFTLMPFGGAGGLHVCELAESLGMKRALVPVHGGVLSALGMLVAPRGRELSRTLNLPLGEASDRAVQMELDALAAKGREALALEGVSEPSVHQSVDLRYAGQSATLNLPWTGLLGVERAFHRAHEARFGHALDLPVELVNVRVGLSAPVPALDLSGPTAADTAGPRGEVSVHGIGSPVPVYDRDTLPAGQRIDGPALITEAVSTTWIAPGWSCEVDEAGNLGLKCEV
ncbi:5-oxoprolinase (ATP-hydrolyzing) [Thioalkalivibrio sulfidiphilus HL-EbGr7]|uniref:5-oxoprolinase (ATP-hydrolyzing) n=1 Tax=Thioalkalivibrio sulfidiphilus (strain HL-EbGR7) TaxID=396588 RepID=B8GUQ8_THISH|nr:hydantoinase/oxoprolinase family protein [Thioalkalivibrio sulfidiphilus]ACL71419.1 5-oxoprolinase (ATP-hydrolyzing) [Thioalkalivibrio sulfidiphilus HL-EbGr7]